ncbi:snRNA-activating protein complex subunit 3 [Eumeta japonica]|uniref:snRNA-activating protein complex subunit 3 n=1 Tax=Eumeta variegata TaxID=151549 RepID=A0A4C1U5Y5_EUMVA|nr:snRNA-activating protein complex subunit 3 [Eumeta japonica]
MSISGWSRATFAFLSAFLSARLFLPSTRVNEVLLFSDSLSEPTTVLSEHVAPSSDDELAWRLFLFLFVFIGDVARLEARLETGSLAISFYYVLRRFVLFRTALCCRLSRRCLINRLLFVGANNRRRSAEFSELDGQVCEHTMGCSAMFARSAIDLQTGYGGWSEDDGGWAGDTWYRRGALSRPVVPGPSGLPFPEGERPAPGLAANHLVDTVRFTKRPDSTRGCQWLVACPMDDFIRKSSRHRKSLEIDTDQAHLCLQAREHPETNAVHASDSHADSEKLLQKFVGEDISGEMFKRLADYCSPEHLRIGDEITIKPDLSFQGHMLNSLESKKILTTAAGACGGGDHLNTVCRLNKRLQKDQLNAYAHSLKYRSLKASPSVDVEKVSTDMLLQPGKELIYRIRLYRPFVHGCKIKSNRSPQLCRDLIMLGSQRLSILRDNITCPNDFGPRIDTTMEVHLDVNAKEIFPSGFLFINNVFYNDMRSKKSIDYSAPIRAWAQRRGIGEFQHKNMDEVRLDELEIKLGYMEGNCEHLFTISEIRLLGAQDQLNPLAYPYETVYSGANLVYCNTCAEFASKWVVVGSDRVPFDPAFLCSHIQERLKFNIGVGIANRTEIRIKRVNGGIVAFGTLHQARRRCDLHGRAAAAGRFARNYHPVTRLLNYDKKAHAVVRCAIVHYDTLYLGAGTHLACYTLIRVM